MVKGQLNLMLSKRYPPGELANILQEALRPYFDRAYRSVQEANEEVRAIVRDAAMAREDDLTKILERLNVRFKPPKLQKASLKTDENREAWLFDSKLNYAEQLHRYNRARA